MRFIVAVKKVLPRSLKSRIKSGNSFLCSLYMFYVKIRILLWSITKSMPRSVQIEPTNACNSNCVMCPRSRMERITGTMSMELYKKIIDDCVRCGIRKVRLHNFGEPFLDKNIIEKIRYAKSAGLYILMYSNFSVPDEKKIREIVDSGLDEIFISLDSSKKDLYEKIRRGLNYDMVKNNIMLLSEVKKKYNNRPKVTLNYVLTDDAEESMHEFKRAWKGIVDDVNVANMHSWANRSGLAVKARRRWPCPMVWASINILWNGDITICCEDYDGEINLGNIAERSLKDIWLGSEYDILRRKHRDVKTCDVPICGKCDLNVFWEAL